MYHGRINYSRTDEDKLKRFQLSLREGRLSYRVISSCHKSFGSSDKLGLKVVIRPLLRRQARKLAPLENVDKATSRRAFPYRHFNNRLKFSLRCLTHKKKKKEFEIERRLLRSVIIPCENAWTRSLCITVESWL